MASFDFVAFSRDLTTSDWGVKVPVITSVSKSNPNSLLHQYELANSIKLRLWSEVTPEVSLTCLNLIRQVIKNNLGYCFQRPINVSTPASLINNCIKVICLWANFFELLQDHLVQKPQTINTEALKKRLSTLHQTLLKAKIKITKIKDTIQSSTNCYRYRVADPSGRTIFWGIDLAPPIKSIKFWRNITYILEDYPEFRVDAHDLEGRSATFAASELKATACTIHFQPITSSLLPIPMHASVSISKSLSGVLKLYSEVFNSQTIQLKNSSIKTFEIAIQIILSRKNIKIPSTSVYPLLICAAELKIEILINKISDSLALLFDKVDPTYEEARSQAKQWYPISCEHSLQTAKKSLIRFFNKRLQSTLKQPQLPTSFERVTEDFRTLSLEEIDLRGLENDSYTLSTEYFNQIAKIFSLRKLRLGEYPITDEDIQHLTGLNRLEELEAEDCHLLETNGLRYLNRLSSLTRLSLLKLVNIKDEDVDSLGTLPLKEASFIGFDNITGDKFKFLTQLNVLALIEIPNLPTNFLENLKVLTSLRTLILDHLQETDQLCDLNEVTSLKELHIWECSKIKKTSIRILMMPHLKKLTLYGKDLEDPGVKDLKLLPNLESLSLSCSTEDLGSITTLTNLRELNLSACSRLLNTSLTQLKSLPALECLRLIDCSKLTDLALVELRKISNLVTLDTRGTCFSIEGLETLLEMPKLSEIYVSMNHTQTGPDLYSRFSRKALFNGINVMLSDSLK